MARYISRDPFSRIELWREEEPAFKDTCAWCGGVKQRPGSLYPYLYRYYMETDNGKQVRDTNAFCSVNCRRCYYY